MTGTLFIVPTPIGNLEDMTLRGLRILREVQLIAAEDTRTSRVLLKHYEIHTPMTSYHEHNKLGKIESIFDALATGDVALISDAGMPGISDPGYELVREAIARGHRVEALPGASALTTALVGSGLPTDSFIYLGFLPRKKLTQVFEPLLDERRTLVAFESPNRLNNALKAIRDVFGPERVVCVACEISKMFENYQRGAVSDVLAYYEANNPRGEITLVIGGASAEEQVWDEEQVRAALNEKLADGDSLSRAAKAVAAESGWKKKAVYALGIEDV